MFKASIEGTDLQVAVKFMFNEKPPSRLPYNSEEFKKARKLPQKLFDSGRIIYYLALCDMARCVRACATLLCNVLCVWVFVRCVRALAYY